VLDLKVFMPAFGLLGIDFGHGFDALPGTYHTKWLEPIMDNNSRIAKDFQILKL
jgi:hypothetical protein